jgi:hypothetical protein
LIPQAKIDKFCEGFQTGLQFCLANGGKSTSNDLWQISECHALKNFLVGNQVYARWTEVKDQQLIKDSLTIGPRWKELSKKWGTRGACQLKNQWYHTLWQHFHDYLPNTKALAISLNEDRGLC